MRPCTLPRLCAAAAVWRRLTAHRRAQVYLMWGDDDVAIGYEGRPRKAPPPIPAPKTKLPGHASSYNPPPEYLLTAEERKQWCARARRRA